MKQVLTHSKTRPHRAAMFIAMSILGTAFLVSTAQARKDISATGIKPSTGPRMEDFRQQLCADPKPLEVTDRPTPTQAVNAAVAASANPKGNKNRRNATVAPVVYRKISPFNFDPNHPDAPIDNTPEEKLFLSRLILQYKMLWNSYYFRNEAQWSATDPKRKFVLSRMTLSREPCLTPSLSVNYVKAYIRIQSEDLLWLLDREMTSSPYPERVQANRQFITESLYKELEKPTLHKMSKKLFNKESAKMNPLPPDPNAVPVDANGQPSYIVITPSGSSTSNNSYDSRNSQTSQ